MFPLYIFIGQILLFLKSTLPKFVFICNIRRDANHRSAHKRISIICTAQTFLKLVPHVYTHVSYCSHFKERLFLVVVLRGVLRSCRPVYPPIAPTSPTSTYCRRLFSFCSPCTNSLLIMLYSPTLRPPCIA